MTGPKSLEICSKTAMKWRGSPPSRIHHSRRNILPTLCWASATTFTDQSKPWPRKQSTRHLRSGLTQVTFRSARWSWLWVTKVQKSRLNQLLSARAHGKWWTVPRPRCPKNMKLSSASSRISRLCTRILAKTWKNFGMIFKMVWTGWTKPLMNCVLTLLLPSWKFPVTWTRQRPRPSVRSWQTGRKKEVST